MDTLHILMVKEREGRTADCFAMYACRDKEPHCAATRTANPTKPCSSCVRGEDTETLEQLIARMTRGNA